MNLSTQFPIGKMTSWSIENFKAIKEGQIHFPGLTVLLGANSSGKSSVIQSILSPVQVLQGNFGNRFPLVGELTRLGTFDEVAHEHSNVVRFVAGFEQGRLRLDFERDEIGKYLTPVEFSTEMEARARKVSLEWGPKNSFRFEVAVVDLEVGSDLFQQAADGSIDRKDLPLATYNISGEYECFGLCGAMVPRGPHTAGGKMLWNPSDRSLRLNNALPASAKLFSEDLETAFLRQLARAGKEEGMRGLEDSHFVDEQDLLRCVESLLAALTAGTKGSNNYDRNAVLNFLEPLELSLIVRLSRDYDSWSEGNSSPLLDAKFIELASFVPQADQSCWSEWSKKFNSVLSSIPASFRYLGPLRLDPQVAQSPNRSTNDCMPVGRNGENATHLIWQAEREKPLKPYPAPDGTEVSSLIEAISLWLDFLELGSPITFKNLGNVGFETLVGGRPIHNLGTGVSQIFPMLALCLSEQTDRIILIEQPELHLHPSSQQKLADFFISMVENGRRIVVETHSEYLVTRLRRRVAVDEINKSLHELVFVEKAEKVSVLKTSKLRDSGQFSYWPKGFFGQVEDDLLAILEADVRKQVD